MRLLHVSMGWVAVVATPLAIALSASCCQIGLGLLDGAAAPPVAAVAGVKTAVAYVDDDDGDDDGDDDDDDAAGSLRIARA
jgi:hypothetical protein